ncbi:MAG: GspE/PulE family protein [bacterium]|nr:GspE/PulE family protein [bacterium]
MEQVLEALLEDGIITERDVAKIRKSKKDVSEYLIEEGFFGEASYCDWFSRTFGFDQLSDSEYLDFSLVKIFPKSLILEHKFLPVRYINGELEVASPNPFLIPFRKIQEFCGAVKIRSLVCSPFKIKRTVEQVFKDSQKGGVEELVEYIVSSAIDMKATDIHIFPQGPCVKFRVAGLLQKFMDLSDLSFQLLVNRIKVMSDLDIAEKRLPQDGRFSILDHDVRVSVVPTSYGEKVALRILKRDFGFSLQNIGLTDYQINIVRQSISKRSGFIFVVGPTGHGKTTTVYSMLKEIDRERLNTISIEDPIEYTLSGVTQIQVNEDIGLSFAKILRHILRQDPDVIFVGEIRDSETADIALKSALTGHLVLTTIHARDVASGILRLIDLGVSVDIILSTVILGISQRLIRILCDFCKGEGCDYCRYTRFRGFEGVFEIIPFDEDLVSKIKLAARDGNLIESELRKIFKHFGFTLLRDEIMEKVQQKKIRESDVFEIL